MQTSSPADRRGDESSAMSGRAEFDTSNAFRSRHRDALDIGPARLAYYRFGSGPDLIFLHGWPLNAATFRGLAARLSDQGQVQLAQSTTQAPVAQQRREQARLASCHVAMIASAGRCVSYLTR